MTFQPDHEFAKCRGTWSSSTASPTLQNQIRTGRSTRHRPSASPERTFTEDTEKNMTDPQTRRVFLQATTTLAASVWIGTPAQAATPTVSVESIDTIASSRNCTLDGQRSLDEPMTNCCWSGRVAARLTSVPSARFIRCDPATEAEHGPSPEC